DYTTTLVNAIAIALGIAVALGLLVWLLGLPFRTWHRRRELQTRASLGEGLEALHQGRYTEADRLLARAVQEPHAEAAARGGPAPASRRAWKPCRRGAPRRPAGCWRGRCRRRPPRPPRGWHPRTRPTPVATLPARAASWTRSATATPPPVPLQQRSWHWPTAGPPTPWWPSTPPPRSRCPRADSPCAQRPWPPPVRPPRPTNCSARCAGTTR